MTEKIIPRRVCSTCGQKKPLAAFLHISAKEGAIYGSICDDCRKSGLDKKKKITLSEEEAGSTSSRHRIGALQRLQQEKEQLRQLKEKKAKHLIEQKKRENTKTEKSNLTKQSEIEEKKRFGFFISPISETKDFPEKKIAPPLVEKMPEEKDSSKKIKLPGEKLDIYEEEKKHREFLKEKEIKDYKIDKIGGATIDAPTTGTEEKNSAEWQRFMDYLGGNSSLGLARQRMRALFNSGAQNKKNSQDNKKTRPLSENENTDKEDYTLKDNPPKKHRQR